MWKERVAGLHLPPALFERFNSAVFVVAFEILNCWLLYHIGGRLSRQEYILFFTEYPRIYFVLTKQPGIDILFSNF